MKKVIICLIVSLGFVFEFIHADVLVISNKDVADEALTTKDVQEIFLGKKSRWKDSTKIQFVTIKNQEIHKAFLKSYVKKSEKQYKNYWRNMVFTGRGIPPKRFKSTRELVEYVSKTEGAVGYIDSNTTAVNVKVIDVKK